jgi:hypothetical protein
MNRVARKHLITDALAAFLAVGQPVKGVRICENGDVLLLTDTPPEAVASNDDGDWVDLAGQTEIPRAQRP